mmetsp:Transcript_36357/g.109102  ORF Transcript_36357/g.109102 Transcript_36357/m.109102 type:complete len:369 (+) Transcript_36357:824-1930(+)
MAALVHMAAAVVRPPTVDCRSYTPAAFRLLVMTPAPMKPTPDATLLAMRLGSYLVVGPLGPTSAPTDMKPYMLHRVKAAAPKDTSAMVRTPAGRSELLRSSPTAAPPSAAKNSRRDSSISARVGRTWRLPRGRTRGETSAATDTAAAAAAAVSVAAALATVDTVSVTAAPTTSSEAEVATADTAAATRGESHARAVAARRPVTNVRQKRLRRGCSIVAPTCASACISLFCDHSNCRLARPLGPPSVERGAHAHSRRNNTLRGATIPRPSASHAIPKVPRDPHSRLGRQRARWLVVGGGRCGGAAGRPMTPPGHAVQASAAGTQTLLQHAPASAKAAAEWYSGQRFRAGVMFLFLSSSRVAEVFGFHSR